MCRCGCVGGVCIFDPERSVGLTNKEIRLSLKPLSHHQTGVEEARPEKQRYSFFIQINVYCCKMKKKSQLVTCWSRLRF